MIPDADRLHLLRIARGAIVAHVSGAAVPGHEFEGPRQGAFVTLHRAGELRGCIGHIDADQPLARIVARCAVAAASDDPRFAPVAATELDELSIELSVLGPLELVASVALIEIGRHGLVVEDGWRRGLLLPQVAVEWRWDGEQFLAHTCRKAGLGHDAWKRGARVWRFEAEVFGEADVKALPLAPS